MTALELLTEQLDGTAKMLATLLDGIDEKDLDYKPHESMMSVRQHLLHLSESYTACLAELRGGSHEWGSFELEDKSLANLTATARKLRAEAVALILSVGNQDAIRTGSGYILQHDHYHIGQISAVRQAVEPSWSSFSLYA